MWLRKSVGLALITALAVVVGFGASDTQPPEIDLETPQEGKEYLLREPVTVSWSARDPQPGSGLAFVNATQDDGDPLATSDVGSRIFTVIAEDQAGNVAQKRVRYWVVYDVSLQKPLGPKAFADDSIPSMTVSVGTEIPFRFDVRDAQGAPIKGPVGNVSVLEADTHSLVYLGETGTGLFRYDAETQRHGYTLDTDALEPGRYRVLMQFNDGRTLFRMDLTLESASPS